MLTEYMLLLADLFTVAKQCMRRRQLCSSVIYDFRMFFWERQLLNVFSIQFPFFFPPDFSYVWCWMIGNGKSSFSPLSHAISKASVVCEAGWCLSTLPWAHGNLMKITVAWQEIDAPCWKVKQILGFVTSLIWRNLVPVHKKTPWIGLN